MNAIFTRSAIEFWSGKPAPPDLHHVVIDHRGRRAVTYAEHMDAKRKRQRDILRIIRYSESWRAWKLEVAYYDQSLMGGWQAMIYTYGSGYSNRRWIDRDGKGLRADLMRLFPAVLPFGTKNDQWEAWKPAFAKTFARRRQDRQPVGVAFFWMRHYELRSAAKQ
jgi:hypothetical protein